MSRIKLLEYDDEVRFEILETQPFGEQDRLRTESIGTAVGESLAELPDELRESVRGEIVFLLRSSLLVGFLFTAHDEASWGPPEEHLLGPYRISRSRSRKWLQSIGPSAELQEPLVWTRPLELSSRVELLGARLIEHGSGTEFKTFHPFWDPPPQSLASPLR